MIQLIRSDKNLCAIFVPGTYSPEETKFITPDDEPLQWGIGVFKKGSVVEPHRHVGAQSPVREFQEFICIRRGLAIAEIFDEEGEKIQEIRMCAGDALLLLRGGHAFQFEEDTELLEVKQGPYQGRENMKVPLHPRNPSPEKGKPLPYNQLRN